jgi:hypothetical protein
MIVALLWVSLAALGGVQGSLPANTGRWLIFGGLSDEDTPLSEVSCRRRPPQQRVTDWIEWTKRTRTLDRVTFSCLLGSRVSSKQSIFVPLNRNTETQSVSGYVRFLVYFAKPKFFFAISFGVSDWYRINRNKQNFIEINRKISKKSSLLGCPQNKKFFGVRTEANQNSICFSCFSVCAEAPPIFLRFVSVFRTGIETNKTNKT